MYRDIQFLYGSGKKRLAEEVGRNFFRFLEGNGIEDALTIDYVNRMMLMKEFGRTPDQIKNMDLQDYRTILEMLNNERKYDTLKSEREKLSSVANK